MLENIDFPKVWHYTGLESPNGEAGFLVKFNDSFSPYRLKIKTPSLPLAQALGHLVEGIHAEDLQANLASIGLRHYELDR
jgi:NADH:ubiquinone oxidoreductase subunit D